MEQEKNKKNIKNIRNKNQSDLSPNTFDSKQEIQSDIMGSYTGVPEDGGKPIQDADDL